MRALFALKWFYGCVLRSLSILSVSVCITCLPQVSWAATPTMIKDINQYKVGNNSNPQYLKAVDNILYFRAFDAVNGNELWKTDGTVDGTVMVKDIYPGAQSSTPAELTLVGNTIFFAAYTVNGWELWKSDGSEAGTVMVKDINPGSGSSGPNKLTVIDNTLYFIANNGSSGTELWKSDGTESGTMMVKDIYSGVSSSSPNYLSAVGSLLYFTATNGVNGSELWKSDGTQAGTVMVKDIYGGFNSSSPNNYYALGSTLFFQALTTSGSELWKTDGTASGTVMVKDIYPGSGGSAPNGMADYGGKLYFSAETPTNGVELWKSDGTEAGTVMVADINPGTGHSGPAFKSVLGETLYFRADDGVNGQELWKTDGTPAGTMLVKDIYPGSNNSIPYGITSANGSLYFVANDGVTGIELWKSDGTESGTELVKDVYSGAGNSSPGYFTAVGTTLYFVAYDPINGAQLWKSDGTAGGTVMIEVSPRNDSSNASFYTFFNNKVYFTASNGANGSELWETDGTEAGTVMVKDIYPGAVSSSNSSYLTAVNGSLYFQANDGVNGAELWKSDGTEAGTMMLKDIASGPNGSAPAFLATVDNEIYFMANDGVKASELWKSDGTEAGTLMVKDIASGDTGSSPNSLVAVGNSVYFNANDSVNGAELWKSDGTEAGTLMVKDIASGSAGSFPYYLVAFGSNVYFRANDGVHGYELWKSDGTEAGTLMVKDIAFGAAGSVPSYLIAVGNSIYFQANDGVNGSELWKSDGTEAGTLMVKDIASGAVSSAPSNLVAVGNSLYFQANDGVNGAELWKSDGTEAGTLMVQDIATGAASSAPQSLLLVDNVVYFTADDGTHSREPWKLTLDMTPPAAPTQIEATDLGVGEVLLTWVNPTDADFDHIVIYRSTLSGQSGTVLIDGLTNISFIDGSVNERTTYRYTVRSVDAAGNESTNTAQVAVTTKDLAPGTPTVLSAVDVTTGNAIDLSWVNPLDSDFNCVNIYRSEVSGVLGALVGNCVAGTSMQDIGLANGVTYYYLARAVDNGGHLSANSNQASATSTSSADSSGAAEVSAISFTDPSNGRTLTLNWTNPADPDLAYALIYRSTNGSKGELIDGVDIQGMEGLSGAWWVDEDVQGCVTYYYTIATLDDAGNESAGVQASHAVADTEAPLPITGLIATPVAGNQVTLSWKPSPSADADCYQVYYATTGSLSPLGTCLPDPASVFTPAPLAADTDYTFAMRTTGACNQMEMNSNTVTVRTSADPAGANSCKATIKSPKIGHTVGGNSVTIVADVSCTGAATVNDVQFEYSADNGSNWVVMSDASAVPLSHPASFPNPDATAPYFVHWDTSAVAGPAAYLLRAVTDTDTDPGTVLITIDNSSVPQALESNGGSQQKTEAVYLNAPGSCVMGDEDGLSAIEIPADALSADTEVLILDVDTPPVAPPSNYVSIGAYKDIHFGNGQGQLNNDKKAKVFLSYTDDDENGIVDGTEILVDDLQLCSDHGNSWTCLNSTVDRANKQVRGYVDKFSTFALMVPPKLVGSSLTMVTVPLHANPNSTASVLGPVNRYGTYTPVWNPATGSWITNPGTVEPGKSYFVWGNGKALDVSGVEVDQVDFDISLVPGWNMIGNPFRYEVAMADLTVSCGGAPVSLQTAANNGWLIGTVYHYVNGSWLTWSVQDGDNLPAWKGLYLLSDQSCTLTVPPNPVGPQNCYDGAACVDYYDSWGWFLFTDCYVNTYCY